MGLDTSYGCWSGPYSSFARVRAGLVRLAWGPDEKSGNIYNYVGYHPTGESTVGVALEFPENDALVILIDHSDCEGDIAAKDCGPLADRLTELLTKMPERAVYDIYRPATERFIEGLRLAAKARKPVEFG